MPDHRSGGVLAGCQVIKENKIAITTPIPDKNGKISKKTPVFHLPIYKVDLKLHNTDKGIEEEEVVSFRCDLADMTDLIGKLKCFENIWRNRTHE